VTVARLALLVAFAAGCSWASASPYEHGAYRKTRFEPTLDGRLAAAHDYLRRYPNGAYTEGVRRYYERAEPIFYESRQRDRAGLEAYLRALPEGPHAAEARSQLKALAAIEAQPDSLDVAAGETERRLADAERSREQARGELVFWIESLVDPDTYAQPLADGPGELVVAFSLSGLVERELAFTVMLLQDMSGKPTFARIEGEQLWSRLEETVSLTLISEDAIDDRATGIQNAAEILASARVAPADGCRRELVDTQILKLACATTVIMTAAPQLGGFDGIEITPK
jgi:hypothetical protein